MRLGGRMARKHTHDNATEERAAAARQIPVSTRAYKSASSPYIIIRSEKHGLHEYTGEDTYFFIHTHTHIHI